MVKAIVYTSNTGFTQKYARLLAGELGLPCYNLDEAKISLRKNTEIVYLGWLMGGFVKGYKKAKCHYNIKAVCGVGMAPETDAERKRLAKQSKVPLEKYFQLQGGFDFSKLKGSYKYMMATMAKIVVPKLENKKDKNEYETEMLEMMKNGKDCVSLEKLSKVIDFLKQQS